MIEGAEDRLRIERPLGSNSVHIFGELGMMAPPQTIPLAVEKPAMTAAWRLQRLLEERGVVVANGPNLHIASCRSMTIRLRGGSAAAAGRCPGRGDRAPPSAAADRGLRFLMKQSQNLHAELLLRRLGLVEGGGSVEDGLAIVDAMLNEAGAERAAWDLSDGSGMSIYNRVTPRMVARLPALDIAAALGRAVPRRRFPSAASMARYGGGSRAPRWKAASSPRPEPSTGPTPCQASCSPKSGETLIFSAYANDRPSRSRVGDAALDATLVDIAETN